jgi:hypothetical protein
MPKIIAQVVLKPNEMKELLSQDCVAIRLSNLSPHEQTIRLSNIYRKGRKKKGALMAYAKPEEKPNVGTDKT